MADRYEILDEDDNVKNTVIASEDFVTAHYQRFRKVNTTKNTTVLASEIREERDTLLAKTDWWASSDLTMTAEQTAYRQALRDVPSQEGFPESITWPTKP